MDYITKKMGIYCIIHLASGKKYIGSAKNIQRRVWDHKEKLRGNKHKNRKLQNAWNKYGEDAFSFRVLDYCEDPSELVCMEQQWIDSVKPHYNINKIATSSLGVKRTPRTCARIKAAKTGVISPKRGKKYGPLSIEVRRKQSEALKGRIFSDTHRANLSKALRGKPRNTETTVRSNNKSGYPGIWYVTRDRRWAVRLNRKYIGQYKTLEEAVRVREKAVQELAMVKKGEREEVKLQAVQGVRQTVYDSGSSEVLLSQVSVA